jgi:hypothetical protein
MFSGFEISGNVIKPYGQGLDSGVEIRVGACAPYGKSNATGWEIQGNIPVPVLALVVFNLLQA